MNRTDNTWVSAEQVDAAMNYIARPIPVIGGKGYAKINQEFLPRVKMPKLPSHLRPPNEPIEVKSWWTQIKQYARLILP